MCGIVGYIGDKNATPIILEGLGKLEYRGYDSAGIAVIDGNTIKIRRISGKLSNLVNLVLEKPISGSPGIGHTRWATHGEPSERNAHPHLGYKGKICSTPATRDLCELMLKDSAFIQEKETENWNKKKSHEPRDPLYSYEDAERVMLQFQDVDYSERIQISDDISFEFLIAGHILGAAFVKVYYNDKGKEKILFFTGDMGRKHLPILKDPQQVEFADYVISESTYGNRLHDDVLTIENELAEIVLKAVRLRGKIIIPAFSVERTQEIVYTLHKLHNEDRIPMLPIYIDSPLAVNVTNVFMKHTEEYDSETTSEFSNNDENPFWHYRLWCLCRKASSTSISPVSTCQVGSNPQTQPGCC